MQRHTTSRSMAGAKHLSIRSSFQGGEQVPAGGFCSCGGSAEARDFDLWGQRDARGSFSEAEDEQGQADHGDQCGDPPVVLHEHGGHGQWSFEIAVAAFDDLLAFVADQDLPGVGVDGVEVGQ
jgi:hypothetical protein